MDCPVCGGLSDDESRIFARAPVPPGLPDVEHKSPIKIGFVTDVEGNLRYFEEYVRRSRVLRYSESGVLELLLPNDYFVFGGDLFDKGPGDIRLAKQLVALKRRYPTRVFLIMGNRDISKFRFPQKHCKPVIASVFLSQTSYASWPSSSHRKWSGCPNKVLSG
jgi:hypothetical protein